jgi:hypothetical protein
MDKTKEISLKVMSQTDEDVNCSRGMMNIPADDSSDDYSPK